MVAAAFDAGAAQEGGDAAMAAALKAAWAKATESVRATATAAIAREA